MKQVRLVGFAALIACALCMVAAAAAEATGPFWEVCVPKAGGAFEDNKCSKPAGEARFERERILEGASMEIEGSAQREFALGVVSLELRCKSLKLASASLKGSTGETAGSSQQTITFKECSVTGNGAPCGVENSELTTAAIAGTLATEKGMNTNGEKFYVAFRPVTGSVFATFKLTGAGCTPLLAGTYSIEGKEGIVGEAWNEAKAVVEYGLNEKLGETNYVNFPSTLVKKAFINQGGIQSEIKPSLKAFGKSVTKFEGTAAVLLRNHDAWGAFS